MILTEAVNFLVEVYQVEALDLTQVSIAMLHREKTAQLPSLEIIKCSLLVIIINYRSENEQSKGISQSS